MVLTPASAAYGLVTQGIWATARKSSLWGSSIPACPVSIATVHPLVGKCCRRSQRCTGWNQDLQPVLRRNPTPTSQHRLKTSHHRLLHRHRLRRRTRRRGGALPTRNASVVSVLPTPTFENEKRRQSGNVEKRTRPFANKKLQLLGIVGLRTVRFENDTHQLRVNDELQIRLHLNEKQRLNGNGDKRIQPCVDKKLHRPVNDELQIRLQLNVRRLLSVNGDKRTQRFVKGKLQPFDNGEQRIQPCVDKRRQQRVSVDLQILRQRNVRRLPSDSAAKRIRLYDNGRRKPNVVVLKRTRRPFASANEPCRRVTASVAGPTLDSNASSSIAASGTAAPFATACGQTSQMRILDHNIRKQLYVSPLPRNMHPVHHSGRREARAKAIHTYYGREPTTVYTDASSYPGIRAMTAVVVQNNKHVTSLTLPGYDPLQAGEAAIAVAITASVIITDSQQACRNFSCGRIHRTTHQIICRRPPDRSIMITWAPAHSAVPGNETAHLLARELSRRAPGSEQERPTPLITYHKITQHYKLGRITYPAPHKHLTKEGERQLRALQTNTFPHPTKCHILHPTVYSPLCRVCGAPGTLFHMIGGCAHAPLHSRNPSIPSRELWERALTSSDLNDQHLLVLRAVEAGKAQGVLD
ncbi:uncharacterized protein LOC144158175 [Haemaphysalis longicornis]